MNKPRQKAIDPDSNKRTTAEEEIALAPLAREGDSDAIYRLCEGNLGLLYHLAGKYANRIHGFGELVSVGYDAMVSAAKGYNPEEHGRRFGCYAGVCIRNEFKGIFMPGRVIRIPQGTAKKIREIMEVQDRLLSDNGSAPSDEEIVRATGYDLRLVRRARTDLRLQLSLSAPVAGGDGEDLTLEGLLAHHDSKGGFERSDRRHDFETIRPYLDKLPDDQRKAVILRYGLNGTNPHTYNEIGKSLEMSDSYVPVILERALNAIRKAIEPNKEKVDGKTADIGAPEMSAGSECEKISFTEKQEKKVLTAYQRAAGRKTDNLAVYLARSTEVPLEVVSKILRARVHELRRGQ